MYPRAVSRLPPCSANDRSYNAPMLEIKLIRDQPDYVRERLAARGAGDERHIDEILALDKTRREKLTQVEALKEKRNRTSKEIGVLLGQKNAAEADAKKAEVRGMGDTISALDKEVTASETARDEI